MGLRGPKFKYDWSKWDASLTTKENAKNIGANLYVARVFASRHKLKFKLAPKGRPKKVLTSA